MSWLMFIRPLVATVSDLPLAPLPTRKSRRQVQTAQVDVIRESEEGMGDSMVQPLQDGAPVG